MSARWVEERERKDTYSMPDPRRLHHALIRDVARKVGRDGAHELDAVPFEAVCEREGELGELP